MIINNFKLAVHVGLNCALDLELAGGSGVRASLLSLLPQPPPAAFALGVALPLPQPSPPPTSSLSSLQSQLMTPCSVWHLYGRVCSCVCHLELSSEPTEGKLDYVTAPLLGSAVEATSEESC